MPIHAIAPSPVARLLLELEARGATGGLDIGGRRIVLTKGNIVEVRPASDDASLGDFLVAAGRLSEEDLATAKRQATEQRAPLEAALRARDLVPLDVLLETRRALWLDRFVRGLAVEERAGKQPGLLTPEPHPSPGPAINTLPFVLDGLARRAGFGDAEQVGREASAWFDWLDTQQRERAASWADFGEVNDSIQAAQLFARHPAAPSRIAALVRAGLARLSEERSPLPHPAPRNPVIAAPAPRPSARPQGSIRPPPRESLRAFSPGQAALERGPLGIEPVASWFPDQSATLDDPLDQYERRIASLEQAGGSPAERARAWLDLGRAFRTHHDSIDESARACREAAAADPRSPEALEAAANMCSATGEPELAYQYALAWADLLSDPGQKARVLIKASEYATRAEKDASALRSLRLAVDAVPDDPVLGERFARVLAARGDLAGALRHARIAAERYRKLRPESARSLLSWAAQLAPDDAELATDYASALAADGYGEAAVAVIARAARRSSDPAARIKLIMHAAVRAELAARPDLASDLLLEALDRQPPDPAQLHEPLANDLAAAGAALELAWLSQEIAEHYKGAERGVWLLRAGEARLELPGDQLQAIELLTQALVADPANTRAYEILVQLADQERDPRIVSDAVERTLSTERMHKPSGLALLDRFLVRLETTQRAPLLERWGWAVSARLGGRGPTPFEQRAMEARLAHFENEIRALEQELRSVAAEGRAAVAVKLADRMRDDPARRHKARKLLEKVLEIDANDSAARKLLTSLLRVLGDQRALCTAESQRVLLAASGFERVASELSWIHAELAAGNLRGAAEACLTLLSHAPKNPAGLLLLWRLARKVGDEVLVREALVRRVEASLDPRERARALMAVSRSLLAAGEPIEAVRRADAALAADPRSAEAAMLLVEYHGELEPAHRVAVLRAARAVLGDTPDLLAKLARACFGTRDPKGQLEALDAHLRLSPFDSFGSLGLAVLWSTGSDPDALSTAVRRVLAPERMHPGAVPAARNALERLWSLGHKTLALELVVEATNGSGELADALVAWALPCAREVDDTRLSRAVLERAVARAQSGEQRVEALRKLAHFHRELGVRHAEARAFLRILASEPSDAEALERLAHIYAETREVERLTSVLTLRLDLAATDDERRERLLALALSAVHLGNDPQGAQELISSALMREIESAPDDQLPLELIQRGVGLLLSSPVPQGAFDLLLELSESVRGTRRIQLLEEAVFIAERYLDNPDLALRAATLGLEGSPSHTPFLLHFERLALDLNDVATGREVYRHLSDSAMGVHGQRAILYRAARWLEQAGALGDALSIAEQAFTLAPSQGAILHTIERLARATGQFAGLVRCLKLLGDDADRPPLKSAFYVRAARLAEDELRDPERAFALYETAFAAVPDGETEARALACARRWASTHADEARDAQTRWREMLRELVKDAWATATRVRALISLGKLSLDVFSQEDDARRYLDDAEQNIAADDELPADERAILNAELATLSARVRPPAPPPQPAQPVRKDEPRTQVAALNPPRTSSPTGAPTAVMAAPAAAAAIAAASAPAAAVMQPAAAASAAVQPAPVMQPAVQAAVQLAPEAGLPQRAEPYPIANDLPRSSTGTSSRNLSAIPYNSTPKTSEPFGRQRITASMLNPLQARPRTHTDPGLAPPVAANAQSLETRVTTPVPAVEKVTELIAIDEVERQVLALAEGDRDALVPMLSAFDGDRTRAEQLCDLLLRALRKKGPTGPGLEALTALGRLAGRAGVVQVGSEALCLFDPAVTIIRPIHGLDPEDPVTKAALLDAREDGDLAPAFTMLAHVYQGAGPLFRRSLTSYGVSASDFISTRDDHAFSAALRDTASLFGVEHEAYLKHSGEDRMGVIPTQPPALLVGDKTHDEPLILRYRMARVFERARPGSVLLSTLSRESTDTLLAALKAAFGPTDGKSPPVPRDAAAMAAELWRTMPSSSQRQVSNLFRVLRDTPPREVLVRQLNVRAARVALVASTGLDVAAAALWTDPLPSEGAPPRVPENIEVALAEDGVFRGIVTYALTESYLELRETLAR
jgi:hypothetical protein